MSWAAQTAEALQAAHTAGVVHRDLKPANLMLTPDGQVKVLDFGIARYMASTHKSSKVIGTLAYMSPDRFGDLPADTRSDLVLALLAEHLGVRGRATIVRGDDFFRPMPVPVRPVMSTAAGYAGHFDWQHLRDQVLLPLASGQAARHEPRWKSC